MNEKEIVTVRSVLPFSMLVGFSGWGGLVYLMQGPEPTLGPRWLFYCAIIFAITGTAAPGVTLLNRLFSTRTPVSFGMIVRESLWVGIYIAALVWLNKGQVMTLGLAIVLAVGLILIEFLLRLRARSEWHP